MAYGAYEYRQQAVLGGSPVHLVVMAYDVALQACEQGDLARSTQAVSLLRDALNFDYPEAAAGFFRVFQWALECLRARNFEAAIAALKPLRDAWAAVENQAPAYSASALTPERSSVVYAA